MAVLNHQALLLPATVSENLLYSLRGMGSSFSNLFIQYNGKQLDVEISRTAVHGNRYRLIPC